MHGDLLISNIRLARIANRSESLSRAAAPGCRAFESFQI